MLVTLTQGDLQFNETRVPTSYLPRLASNFLKRELLYSSFTALSLTQHFFLSELLSDFCKNELMSN